MIKKLQVLSLILVACASVQAADLVHRWSFNGDLTDSIGDAHAVIEDAGANNATISDTQVTLAGGAKDASDYIDLPDGILSGIGSTSITIEFWATQHSVRNWSRIFDFGSTTTDNIFMSWSVGTTLENDRVEWVPATIGGIVDGTNAPYDLDVEYHIVMVIEPGLVSWYTAPADSETLGELRGSFDVSGSITELGGDNNWIGRSQWPDDTANASYNEFRLWSGALTADELQANHEKGPDGIGPKGRAANPVPGDEASDVLRDVTVSWDAGEYAGTHDVYLSESAADVDDASRANTLGIQLAQGWDANSVDVGHLEFGKTYYWRVDEVNGSPDRTVIKGAVWTFEIEPYSLPVSEASITVTASSISTDFSTAQQTIDGSGLGADGMHAISPETMWFTGSADLDPWIQYEFDDTLKLDTMKVWNSNSSAEMAIGWGVKDVVIEYSVDGENWSVLEGANQFSRAPGAPTYNQYDEIAMNGIAAKYIRLDIESNWGGILMAYGLAEVQFTQIPVTVRTPKPASGASDILPDAIVEWRAGREAVQHTLYISTDAGEVTDGTAASATYETAEADLSAFDLQMGETYYWRVDEVNEADAVTVWSGAVWSLTILDTLTVDDFESYGNASPNRPFQTWLDGFGYSADEFFPVPNPGNGTGSAVGHDIWSMASAYFGGELMETSSAADGSNQSMPINYTGNSRVDRTLTPPQDWTAAGIKTLVLFVKGDRDNADGSLYVEINGQKISNADSSVVTEGLWAQWNLDLASVGAVLSSVSDLSIGVDSSGSGVIYVDEIRLYKDAPESPVSVDPGATALAAQYSMENNVTDSSGNGLDGILVSDQMYVESMPGMGQALSFDGLIDYVELPIGPVIASAESMTVALWVDFSNEGGAWQRLFDFGSGSGASPYMFLTPRVGANGELRFAIRSSTVGEQVFSAPSTLASGWQHVAVTIDGTDRSVALYLNGTVVASGATAVLPQDMGDTTQNYLGKSQWPDALYQGSLDEVLVFTRSLSHDEIRYLAGDK